MKEKTFNNKTFTVREILSEGEVQQLGTLENNPELKEALRKLLLFPIYYSGTLQKGESINPMVNWLFGLVAKRDGATATDEQIGRDLRIQHAAVNLVEFAFDEIAKFKVFEPGEPQEIEAR